MATSSIFENLVIKGTNNVELFVNGLEASANGKHEKPGASGIRMVTDIEEIRKMMGVKTAE